MFRNVGQLPRTFLCPNDIYSYFVDSAADLFDRTFTRKNPCLLADRRKTLTQYPNRFVGLILSYNVGIFNNTPRSYRENDALSYTVTYERLCRPNCPNFNCSSRERFVFKRPRKQRLIVRNFENEVTAWRLSFWNTRHAYAYKCR